MNNPFHKRGPAHTAAVKAARPAGAIDREATQVAAAIGAREYQRQMLVAEINALCGRAQELEHEGKLAKEKAEQEKQDAARDAAQETA